MLDFAKVKTIEDIQIISSYINRTDSHFSTENPPNFFIWQDAYPREYCVLNETLIVREHDEEGEIPLYYFKPIGKDVEGAIKAIEKQCQENLEDLVFANLTESEAKDFQKTFPTVEIGYDRGCSDYIYLGTDMASFVGRKFSGQRNHINKFKKLYGDYEYVEITKDNINVVTDFLQEFYKTRPMTSESETQEQNKIFEFFENYHKFDLVGGYIVNHGKVVAMSTGMIRGDMLFVTVEKALKSYEGSYQVMVQEFAKHHISEKVKYINREDDMGVEGLRKSKMQYQPIELLHKYYVVIKTLFEKIKDASENENNIFASGEKVFITDVMEDDCDKIMEMILHQETARLWDYDYRAEPDFEENGKFYWNFIKQMKETREEYSFAIRKKIDVPQTDSPQIDAPETNVSQTDSPQINKGACVGEFVGELVFHNFDFHNGFEIGLRILPEYRRQGFANDAIKSAVDFGKKLGGKKIQMKCLLENIPSCKMIEKCGFTKIMEDEKYIYFIF